LIDKYTIEKNMNVGEAAKQRNILDDSINRNMSEKTSLLSFLSVCPSPWQVRSGSAGLSRRCNMQQQ
jgi:hypothetical protein